MAGNYTQVSSHTQDELRGTRLVRIRVVAFTTIPSNIYAEERIDLSIIDPTAIGGIIEVLATGLEVVAGRHDVAGLSYFQDVNAVGQLVDKIEVIVQSTSGNSTAAQDYPLNEVFALSLGSPLASGEPSIPEIAAELDAIEGL